MTYDAPSVGMAIAMVDERFGPEDEARSKLLEEQIRAMGGLGDWKGREVCQRGHSRWGPTNLGFKRCLTCRAERQRAARAKRRQA